MSYDVYWVKNRAEKITDFEHPTCKGNCKKQWNVRAALTGRVVRKCLIPRAVPWAVESCPFG